MAKYIDADRLRAEIENYCKECENSYGEPGDNNFPFGKVTACHEIMEIIDYLQQEQPKVDLEKEIADYWTATGWCRIMILSKFKVIARHFYGLGQQNINAEPNKIEDAFKYYTDRGITISCGDLIAKPKDLEVLDEAAEKYADNNSRRWQEDGDIYYDYSKIMDAFKAGAEWMRERMIKDAVDGRVSSQYNGEPLVCARLPKNNKWGLKICDKVKLIIVKEDNR